MNHVLGEKKLLAREKEELEEQVQVLSDSLNDSMAKFNDSLNDGYPTTSEPPFNGTTNSDHASNSRTNTVVSFSSIHRSDNTTDAAVIVSIPPIPPSTPQPPQSQSKPPSQTRASEQPLPISTATATVNPSSSSSSSSSPNASSSSPEFSWLKQSLPTNTNNSPLPMESSTDNLLTGSTSNHSQNLRSSTASASVDRDNHTGGGMNGNTGTPKKRVTFTRNDIFSQMDDFDDIDMSDNHHHDPDNHLQQGMSILANANNNNSSPFHALMQSVSVDLHWARPAGK